MSALLHFASIALRVIVAIVLLGAAIQYFMDARKAKATIGGPITPKSPPPAINLRKIKPGAALRTLRETLTRKELIDRIDDVRAALAEAHGALIAKLPNALDVAARCLVKARWATGVSWKRYLHEIQEFDVGARISTALDEDARPVAGQVARLLAERPSPTLVTREGVTSLACDACGEPAVTFLPVSNGFQCSTLSPVNLGPAVPNEEGAQLGTMLAAGNARGVLDQLTRPAGTGCMAYCPECDRVYCRDHYAIEAKWSGSWHEATDATCALGHWREIE